MNMMSAGMWRERFVIVDMRTRKLLKWLVATPMRRSELLGAVLASRLVLMAIEMMVLLLLA